MEERDGSLEQSRPRMVEGRGRHQVVNGPLVDAGERAGGDEHGERRVGDRQCDGAAESSHELARPVAS